MGVLIKGNFGSDKVEHLETISCPHCQCVRAITLQGCTKNVPYNYWCWRCHAPICRGCAEAMENLGQCPGPFVAKVDEEVRTGTRIPDDWVYQYRR